MKPWQCLQNEETNHAVRSVDWVLMPGLAHGYFQWTASCSCPLNENQGPVSWAIHSFHVSKTFSLAGNLGMRKSTSIIHEIHELLLQHILILTLFAFKCTNFLPEQISIREWRDAVHWLCVLWPSVETSDTDETCPQQNAPTRSRRSTWRQRSWGSREVKG